MTCGTGSPEPAPTFALQVLGCRSNQAEIEALRAMLLELGAREVPFPGPARLVIVNTCAVTNTAEAQSRQVIRRAIRAKRGGCLLVTGCAAQRAPESLAALSGVDLVLGNAEKSVRAEDLAALLRDGAPSPEALIRRSVDPTLPEFLERRGAAADGRTRAVVKIQDGCHLRCSYCVVAGLRGAPVSRPRAAVRDEVRRLVAAGHEEIVLSGINLGLYAAAPDPGADSGAPRGAGDCGPGAAGLGGLLADLDCLPGRFRVRLSSLEPMTISPALLDQLAGLRRLCRHFHLALQSGDDAVLARMARPYDRAAFAALVSEIASRFPLCGLGVDVIAGFPGETEEAFDRTRELVARLPVTYLHAFAYSERPGTAAASMGPPVPPAVRKARVGVLRRLDEDLRARFQGRLRGRDCTVVVESFRGGAFRGLTEEFVRMTGRARDARPGALLAVVAGAPLGPHLQECRVAPAGCGV